MAPDRLEAQKVAISGMDDGSVAARPCGHLRVRDQVAGGTSGDVQQRNDIGYVVRWGLGQLGHGSVQPQADVLPGLIQRYWVSKDARVGRDALEGEEGRMCEADRFRA